MLSILIRHDCCIYKSGLKCIHVIWTTIYNYHLPGPYEEPGTRYTVCWLPSICFLDPFSALIHSLYPGRQTPVTCFPCCRLLVRYGQWEKSSGDQKGQGKEVGYSFPVWLTKNTATSRVLVLARPGNIVLSSFSWWEKHHGYEQFPSVTSSWVPRHLCPVPLTLPTPL